MNHKNKEHTRVSKTVGVDEALWNEFKGFCIIRGESLEDGIERILHQDNEKFIKTKFKY